ncbi:hypothetical protein MUG78_17565 [Gordonia alkaliphila]|uniref:hypothetical protein n=1 Tax=Gordonia alkaliphila TaxID=1053547 RepID=UPI001FF5BDB8|nr:hypothetical protein [Gordonia alkaliphila]MCK0441210.1 hypothetical protein [Gordonia alkaliphila]
MRIEYWQLAMGIVLTAIQILLLIPLGRSVWRTRDMTGISPAGEGMWVLMGVGWLVYGQQSGSLVLMVSGSVAAAGSVIMLSGGWPSLSVRGRRSALLSGLATFVLVGIPLAGWGLLGLTWSLAVLGAVQFLPQCWSVWRAWRHDLPSSGADPATALWRMAYVCGWAVYAAGWFLFGYARMDVPLLVWGLSGRWRGATALQLRAVACWRHPVPDPRTPHTRRGTHPPPHTPRRRRRRQSP